MEKFSMKFDVMPVTPSVLIPPGYLSSRLLNPIPGSELPEDMGAAQPQSGSKVGSSGALQSREWLIPALTWLGFLLGPFSILNQRLKQFCDNPRPKSLLCFFAYYFWQSSFRTVTNNPPYLRGLTHKGSSLTHEFGSSLGQFLFKQWLKDLNVLHLVATPCGKRGFQVSWQRKMELEGCALSLTFKACKRHTLLLLNVCWPEPVTWPSLAVKALEI